MKHLYEFTPNETGYDSFFVMSESLDKAIEAVEAFSKKPYDTSILVDGSKIDHYPTDYEKYRHKYRIKEYGENEVAWNDNC